MLLLWKAVVLEMAVQGLQAHPQKFWFAENRGRNGAQGLHKITWRPFSGGYTKKRSSWSLWEKICRQKLHKKLFGQNPSHPKICLLLRLWWKAPPPPLPLLKGQKRKCRRHASILRSPCAYYSTRTLFTRCCKLRCVTAMIKLSAVS